MTIEVHIKNALKEFKPVGKKIDLWHQNLNEHSSRYFSFNKGGNKFKLFVFDERLLLEVKATTDILFAINLPDNVCLANKLLNTNTYKLFVNDEENALVEAAFNLIKEDVKILGLASNEGVFVYSNAIQLVLNKTRSLIDEINILSSIKLKLERESDQNLDFSGLPLNLRDLVPFLNRWSISDDKERDEAINQASKEEIKQLTKYVNSKMKDINEYLDSFNSIVMPDEAILIGNLAELVSEINLVKHTN
jgi:hypothetical protein